MAALNYFTLKTWRSNYVLPHCIKQLVRYRSAFPRIVSSYDMRNTLSLWPTHVEKSFQSLYDKSSVDRWCAVNAVIRMQRPFIRKKPTVQGTCACMRCLLENKAPSGRPDRTVGRKVWKRTSSEHLILIGFIHLVNEYSSSYHITWGRTYSWREDVNKG